MTDKVRFCYVLCTKDSGKKEYFDRYGCKTSDFSKARIFGRTCDLKNSRPYRSSKRNKIAVEITKVVIVDPN